MSIIKYMVKIPLYIAFCVALIFVSLSTPYSPRLEMLGSGEFAIYSREYVMSPLVTRRIESGLGFIYFTHSANAQRLRAKFTHIDGESITLDHHKPTRDILRKLGYRSVASNKPNIYYGFSSRATVFIRNGNTRINLQIAQRNGVTTVGWPVILGSF